MEFKKIFKILKKVKKSDFWPFFSVKVWAHLAKFPIMTFVNDLLRALPLKTKPKVNRM